MTDIVDVSPEAMQAILAQRTSKVFLSFLKVEHPSLPAPILRVFNTTPITRADGVYTPYAFNAPSPEQTEGTPSGTTITVDNTDLELGMQLRALVGPPTVTIFTALADQPDVIEEGPFELQLNAVTGDSQSITGQLGYDSRIWNQNIPAQLYTPSNSPGLYK